MTDPKYLIEEASEFEAKLLRAGRKDALSERSALSITAALGVATSATATSSLAFGAKLATAKGALAVGGLTATGALMIWAGVSLVSGVAPVATPQQQLETRKQLPAVAVRDTLPTASSPATKLTEPTPPKAPAQSARAPVSAEADTLERELELIDRARSALARGEAALSLSLLDEYSARFPKSHLRVESTLLRIEALVVRGQSDAAVRLGKQFLAREPNSPYARRVRSLLERASAPPAR